jgi:hypothetical protein
MEISRYSRIISRIFILIVIILSYRFFSSRYYALLNSDDALNVLMTHYYKLPQDLYCWGQNRGGTLVPLLGQFFLSLNFSAINAVSLSNYTLLILGFLGFSSLIRNNFLKLAFAVFWFLPPVWFIDMLRFPYGMEYCLIGMAVPLITRLQLMPHEKKPDVRQHLCLIGLVMLFVSAVWVSDLAIITVCLLLSALFIHSYIKNKSFVVNSYIIFYVIAGLIAGGGFILFAKFKAADASPGYMLFNSFSEAADALVLTFQPVADLLLFKLKQPVMSIYAWLCISFLITLLVLLCLNKGKHKIPVNRWFIFFLLDAVIIFVLIMFSNWVKLDGYGRRFFICTYISFGILIFLFVDHLTAVYRKAYLIPVILAIGMTGFGSTLHFIKYYTPGNFIPVYERMSEFKRLGKCFIMAEYWNSYITAVADPENIIVIPHQDNNNRNAEMLKKVQQAGYIYIMKDNWMDGYPYKTYQYWHLYYKDGNAFEIAGKTVCRYKKIR